jgi:monoterpene epsilon-lactone hydrolase
LFATSLGYCGIECHLSDLFNVTILHLEYRLSPEHAFPVAVDDTIAVYRTLLRHNISASDLIFMGDSAGGGLALLTIQALIKHQLPVPRGVVVLSPWADLSTSSESYTRNEDIDPMLHIERIRWVASQLLGPNRTRLDLYDPLLSPLFGSFKGFPPMYVTVGTTEIIEDDSHSVVKRAQEAGVDVTFEEGLHMMHIYPIFFPYFPEARQTLDNIHRWIQTLFAEH